VAAATTAQIEHERSISEAVGVDDGVSDTTCTPTCGGGRPTRVGEGQIPLNTKNMPVWAVLGVRSGGGTAYAHIVASLSIEMM